MAIERLSDLFRIAVPRFGVFRRFLVLERHNLCDPPSAIPVLLNRFAAFQLSKRMADRRVGQ